ncbi:hypothetical protein NDU88_004132 [Pleurodeles waltl]|uniref:Uncharacterized protein n=1 Tax=Pleurodeles waltl TaxID=8319 RepID=A0AAV7QHK0_PLEWA|nr:hypothetical protein NDU88_004132 [Pleurodeles waltl]
MAARSALRHEAADPAACDPDATADQPPPLQRGNDADSRRCPAASLPSPLRSDQRTRCNGPQPKQSLTKCRPSCWLASSTPDGAHSCPHSVM